ncbi:MAG: peptidyl-prolyl cis-trans isomerase [Candidatus Scalindua rubra]|uniref:Peptidyl-prolyl cis-trans isomerase n=1 Tax=Candidatus Scalindua rubra TaxID=1872076 RepID=A0A1E3XA17_9BACT|nr:MAG: peptidyl-prolyl cis-trans isomerase [Candidatus Scalindua rubra]
MKILKLSLVFFILHLFYLHQSNADNLNAIRVIVNGEIITEFDIRKRIAEAFKIAEKKYSEIELQQKKREIISDAIDELIDRKILVQEAKKVLLADPEKAEEIEKNLDSFVKGAVEEVGSLYKFYELAHKQGINPLKKRAELKKDLMIEEIMRGNVYRKIIVTPKEIKRYYQEHTDEFSRERRLSFRQILIKFSGYKTKEEAKSVTEELLNRLKNGEEFEALAKKHSQGPHSDEGGLWEFDEVKDFRKDLTAGISNLKKGEISQILDSSLGHHIFKVEEIIPAQTLTFQQAQDEIRNMLFREEFVKKRKEYLKELRKNVVIKRYY